MILLHFKLYYCLPKIEQDENDINKEEFLISVKGRNYTGMSSKSAGDTLLNQ
jgi:hypothetical protein